MRQLLPAAFMAPDLVTAIAQGRQPKALTLARLKAMLPLPSVWQQQRQLFATLN